MGFQARISGWNSGDAGIRRRTAAATSGRWWWAALLGPHAPCRPVRHGGKLSLGLWHASPHFGARAGRHSASETSREAFAGRGTPFCDS